MKQHLSDLKILWLIVIGGLVALGVVKTTSLKSHKPSKDTLSQKGPQKGDTLFVVEEHVLNPDSTEDIIIKYRVLHTRSYVTPAIGYQSLYNKGSGSSNISIGYETGKIYTKPKKVSQE